MGNVFSADLRSLVAHRIFYGVIFMAKTALPECSITFPDCAMMNAFIEGS